MKIHIFCVGKMKSGPEQDLVFRYLDRLSKQAPALGMSFGGVHEISESRAKSDVQRKREEADKLKEFAGKHGGELILLDERGTTISSPAFAKSLQELNDQAVSSLVFCIGGPDGHDAQIRQQAMKMLSFGKMTWPHQMARIMLAEQLYRATTIISGHPYHRV